MKRNNARVLFSIMLFFSTILHCTAQITVDKQFTGNKTLNYEECIKSYENFSKHENAHLIEMGKSDIGKPMHLFLLTSETVSMEKEFNPANEKVTLFINNAIHPGEPCGVDASVMLVESLLENPDLSEVLKKMNLAIIPMYNIGGGLNRGCCSRANQNGPEFYGFRGNARNLDLNRDFIKCDSKNAEAFMRIFQFLKPHIFLDTHTSNGADYQHIMTLITTQPDKATPPTRAFLRNTMVPELFSKMDSLGYPMAPYVHTINATPDDGIKDYLDPPRYSTGYAALFNSLGFVSEAHMLKPYEERVQSTYALMTELMNFSLNKTDKIIEIRKRSDKFVAALNTFEINWEMDTVRVDSFLFKGYEAKYKKSEFSQNDRLYYDRSEPYEKYIPYYDRFIGSERVGAPDYYVIPQAWSKVIDMLKTNKVEMIELKNDTILEVEFYKIEDYETRGTPYEGHYLHSQVKVSSETAVQKYYAGDVMIPVNQTANRYIVETLEPTASDSYFCWNFFDSVLQQKEWFSTYVFEDKAAAMLEESPKLRKEFEEKQANSPEFSSNQWAQLYWLYQRSDNYEPTANRYPVARLFVERD